MQAKLTHSSNCAARTSRKYSRPQAASQRHQAQQTQHAQQIHEGKTQLSSLTPPDVTVDSVNDLEQRPTQGSGVVLVPRSAVLFPPGFRGYWQSAPQQQQQQQQQQKIQGMAEPVGLLDSSSSHAGSSRVWGSVNASGKGKATQDSHLQAVIAEMQAIPARREAILKPSSEGDLSAWAVHQLEHASHWKAVDAVVQVLEQPKAGASKATAVDWRRVGAPVLERALLRLQELGLDTQLLGAQGFGRSDWDSLGSRISALLTSCCQASSSQPVHDRDPQRVERMANVISTAHCLGPSFYCRAYCDAAILSAVQSLSKPSEVPWDSHSHVLPHLLAACAECGHMLKQSWLSTLVPAAIAQLPHMDTPSLVRLLWSCTKYRLDVRRLQIRVSSRRGYHEVDTGRGMRSSDSNFLLATSLADEDADDDAAAAAAAATAAAPPNTAAPLKSTSSSNSPALADASNSNSAAAPLANASNSTAAKSNSTAALAGASNSHSRASSVRTTTTSILDFILTHLRHDLHFWDLTPALAAQLLAAVAASGAQPDTDFMDECLLSLLVVQRQQAPATSSFSAQPRGPLLQQRQQRQQQQQQQQQHMFRQPAAAGILLLLSALAKLGYQPPEEVSSAILEALRGAMAPSLIAHHSQQQLLQTPRTTKHSLRGRQQQQQQLLQTPRTTKHSLQAQQQQQVMAPGTPSHFPDVQQMLISSDSSAQQPLPPEELGRAAKWLASLQIRAPTTWCQEALEALLAAPGGPPLSAACRLMGELPELMGVDNKAMKPWVNWNQPALERVTLSIGPHLKAASCQDLLEIITGFAKLRYYPGTRFMHWHQAACWQSVRRFPWETLVMVRAAYTSLGCQAELRLSKAMDTAQRRLTKKHVLQLRRAGQATQGAALKVPRSQQAKVGRRQRPPNRRLQFATQRLGTPTAFRTQPRQHVRSGPDRRPDGRAQNRKVEETREAKGPEEELEGLLGNLDV